MKSVKQPGIIGVNVDRAILGGEVKAAGANFDVGSGVGMLKEDDVSVVGWLWSIQIPIVAHSVIVHYITIPSCLEIGNTCTTDTATGGMRGDFLWEMGFP